MRHLVIFNLLMLPALCFSYAQDRSLTVYNNDLAIVKIVNEMNYRRNTIQGLSIYEKKEDTGGVVLLRRI